MVAYLGKWLSIYMYVQNDYLQISFYTEGKKILTLKTVPTTFWIAFSGNPKLK